MANVPSPRPYQTEALNAIHREYPTQNRLLIAHATGLGKGLIPIWLAIRYEAHVRQHGLLFIAHRRKILFQAYERFMDAFGDSFWTALEMGENEATGQEEVVFMSIDSVGREYQQRIKKYRNRHFGVVCVDEGHHISVNSKWDRVLGYFGVGSDPSTHYNIRVDGENVPPLAIHLTATPEDQMAPFIDEIAHSMSILEGIKEGWLTDIKSYYAQGVDSIEGMCRAYQKYLSGEQTMIFAASVDESKQLTAALNDAGIAHACHVDAETPKENREVMNEAFSAGSISTISNRLVHVEGSDFPNMTAMMDTAPTREQRVATQKWGRLVRVHPSANVDACETAEERRNEIKQSEKPFGKLLCTWDPTRVGVTITHVLSDYELEVDEDEKLAVEEVIEVLEEYEEERPEVDLSKIESFDDADLALTEADIFRRTIYNDRLKEITELNWVTLNSKTMGLWVYMNPFTGNSTYENCATVLLLRQTDRGIERQVISGGWNGSFPASLRASGWKSTPYDDTQTAIKSVDRWLRKKYPRLYENSIRGGSWPASQKLKEHLRNKDVPITEDVSEETAKLLKMDTKIRNKIESANVQI
jgi:superfamily II DNA or RNA helicase